VDVFDSDSVDVQGQIPLGLQVSEVGASDLLFSAMTESYRENHRHNLLSF